MMFWGTVEHGRLRAALIESIEDARFSVRRGGRACPVFFPPPLWIQADVSSCGPPFAFVPKDAIVEVALPYLGMRPHIAFIADASRNGTFSKLFG
jgi:hypothetical protein